MSFMTYPPRTQRQHHRHERDGWAMYCWTSRQRIETIRDEDWIEVVW